MVVLFSFVVMVDVALNVDRFIERAEELLKGTNPTTLREVLLTANLIVDIWWPRLLQLFNYTIGFGLMAAMGFTLTQLVRHREVVAMLASGISLFRVIRPIMVIAAVLLGVKVLNQELVISHPRIAPLLARDPGDAGTRDLSEFPVPPTADGQGRIFFARRFEPREGVMTGVEVWERDKAGVVASRISAAAARWAVDAEGVGGWQLEGATLNPMTLGRPGEAGGGAGQPRAPTRIETDLKPETLLFKRFASFSQSLSWSQIGSMLRSGSGSGSAGPDPLLREKLQRIRWGRVSMILSTALSLLITMPFFLLREPRNMLVQSLKCAPVGIVSLMGGVLLAAVPVPGLPAGFAVFLPVFILLPVAVAVLFFVRS